MKQIPFEFLNEGSVLINHVFMYHESDSVCAVVVDMTTKHAELEVIGSENDLPTIAFSETENSICTDKRKKGQPTEIIITDPKFLNWNVWSIMISKYTAYVCLVKG